MPDFSYECTKATIRETLPPVGDIKLFLCDLQFVDEHGHEFKPVENVLVYLKEGRAELASGPEDVLPGNAPEEEWKRLEALCENHPGYEVYNSDEFTGLLLGKEEPKKKYHVYVKRTLLETWEVAADSPEEAEENWEDGEYLGDDEVLETEVSKVREWLRVPETGKEVSPDEGEQHG